MADHRIILAVVGVSIIAAVELHAAEPAAPAARPIPTLEEYENRSRRFSAWIESALEEPFVGVTTDGRPRPGFFEIVESGVSTEGVIEAAGAFIASLGERELRTTLFAVDDVEWRKWANQHIYRRDGLSFEAMSADQRASAFALLGASLSAKGLELSRDIMRLNETLAELNNDNHVDYGEWKYHLSILGEPGADTPWGWQLDGHHLNLNYFVLGDQVVLSPAFWGSEPVVAHAGKYRSTRIMADEQATGLAFIRSLTPTQAEQAILETTKTDNQLLADAFKDNLVLDYAGVSAATFNDRQRADLLALINLYIGNLRHGHAEVRMADIEEHLDDTYFAWIGGTGDDAVFYYRIHGPVVLIEFDHQNPVGLRHVYPEGPTRDHVHAVVRTPNGNDYGKDLLRQHYLEHDHSARGHR